MFKKSFLKWNLIQKNQKHKIIRIKIFETSVIKISYTFSHTFEFKKWGFKNVINWVSFEKLYIRVSFSKINFEINNEWNTRLGIKLKERRKIESLIIIRIKIISAFSSSKKSNQWQKLKNPSPINKIFIPFVKVFSRNFIKIRNNKIYRLLLLRQTKTK